MARLPKGVCLLVTDIDSPSGGIQKGSLLLLKELRKRGVATYACVRNYHNQPRSETIDGTVFHRSVVLGRGRAVNGVLYFAETLIWLIRNRRKYEIIHCEQMFGPTMVAAVASYFLKKPILTRVNTVGELGEVKQIREMPLARVRLGLIRRVSRWAALTREMKKELMQLGIPADAIRIVYNSTDIPPGSGYDGATKMRLRHELGLGAGKIAVFVGRLSDEKNLDVLIEAWVEVQNEFPQARLLLLGEGGTSRNVESRLRDLVHELGLDQSIDFLGHVARVKDYVMSSDVFVLPSRTEGMSNALVEAFACGAAIVATDIPGSAEICVHEVNSLVVPVGDSHALARAINEIFGSPALAERLGAAARRKAEGDLSVDKMVEAYLAVYEEMLNSSAQ